METDKKIPQQQPEQDCDYEDEEEEVVAVRPKTCYYELLGVPRSAETTTEDIKRAYKFKALKNHPDKNKDKPDAKEIFQELNIAYQCLCEPNERTWYDNHRTQILSGKTKKSGHEMSKQDKADEAWGADIVINKFLSGGCYKGHNDEAKGFYSVYRNLFEKIKDLEEEEQEMDEGSKRAPGFGDMNYDLTKVTNFYDHWDGFTSKRLFAYADLNNPNDAQNRWEKREMEKENKKERTLEKASYTKTVKNIVAFVKRSDPRSRNAEIYQRQQEQLQKDTKKREQLEKKQNLIAKAQEEQAQKIKLLEEQRENQKIIDEMRKIELKKLEEQLDGKETHGAEKQFFCEDCNVDFSKDYMPKQCLKKHCDTKEHRKKAQVRLLDKLRKQKASQQTVVFQPKEKDGVEEEESKTQEPVKKEEIIQKEVVSDEEKKVEPEVKQRPQTANIQPAVSKDRTNKKRKNKK